MANELFHLLYFVNLVMFIFSNHVFKTSTKGHFMYEVAVDHTKLVCSLAAERQILIDFILSLYTMYLLLCPCRFQIILSEDITRIFEMETLVQPKLSCASTGKCYHHVRSICKFGGAILYSISIGSQLSFIPTLFNWHIIWLDLTWIILLNNKTNQCTSCWKLT